MPTKKTKTAEGDFRGIHWESPEELNFLQWAFELVDADYIESIERSESFILAEPFKSTYKKVTGLKTKIKEEIKSETILNGHIYTPEYKIVWTKKGVDKFIWEYTKWNDNKYNILQKKDLFVGYNNFKPNIINSENSTLKSYFEIKPTFDQNNMTRLFKINQKWMWDKYKIFINLVHPQELFASTFTPLEYCKTPTGKSRIISKWKVKTLKQFLENDNTSNK